MHLAITPVVLENLSEMVPKSSQNLSKIDLGGDLGATWEPPLRRGDPKTSFLTISAPFWDPIWGPVWAHFGHHFLMFFWYGFRMAFSPIWGPFGPYFGTLFWAWLEAVWATLHNTWNVRKHQYLLWFKHVGALRKVCFLVTFGIIFWCFLGSVFWEGSGTTFWRFWLSFGVPFGGHFGHFWGTVFASIFGGFRGSPEVKTHPRWKVIWAVSWVLLARKH